MNQLAKFSALCTDFFVRELKQIVRSKSSLIILCLSLLLCGGGSMLYIQYRYQISQLHIQNRTITNDVLISILLPILCIGIPVLCGSLKKLGHDKELANTEKHSFQMVLFKWLSVMLRSVLLTILLSFWMIPFILWADTSFIACALFMVALIMLIGITSSCLLFFKTLSKTAKIIITLITLLFLINSVFTSPSQSLCSLQLDWALKSLFLGYEKWSIWEGLLINTSALCAIISIILCFLFATAKQYSTATTRSDLPIRYLGFLPIIGICLALIAQVTPILYNTDDSYVRSFDRDYLPGSTWFITLNLLAIIGITIISLCTTTSSSYHQSQSKQHTLPSAIFRFLQRSGWVPNLIWTLGFLYLASALASNAIIHEPLLSYANIKGDTNFYRDTCHDTVALFLILSVPLLLPLPLIYLKKSLSISARICLYPTIAFLFIVSTLILVFNSSKITLFFSLHEILGLYALLLKIPSFLGNSPTDYYAYIRETPLATGITTLSIIILILGIESIVWFKSSTNRNSPTKKFHS